MTQKTKETHQDSEVHIVRPPVYLAIFLALMVLTALTTGISFIDLGVFNAVIALAIACLKASLVVLFFMHIHYSSLEICSCGNSQIPRRCPRSEHWVVRLG